MSRWIDRLLWLLVVIVALLAGDRYLAQTSVAQPPAAPAAKEAKNESPNPNDAPAKTINERNVFMPPKPEGFRGKLTAVFGDAAVFNDSQVGRVGDDIMGAKIKAIGNNWVEVEFEGKTIRQEVFDQKGMPPDMKAALEKQK